MRAVLRASAPLLRAALDPAANLDAVLAELARARAGEAALVRAANAERYGMPGRITGLKRVVTVLGVRAAAEITVAVHVRGALCGRRFGAIAGDALWLHALDVAAAAESLADALDLGAPLVFSCGLLHDAGIALLSQQDPNAYDATGALDADGLVERERACLGTTHADALAAAAADAGLPAGPCSVLAHHHDPAAAPASARAEVALLAAAHALAPANEAGWSDAARDADGAFEWLGLTPGERDALAGASERAIKRARQAFPLSDP